MTLTSISVKISLQKRSDINNIEPTEIDKHFEAKRPELINTRQSHASKPEMPTTKEDNQFRVIQIVIVMLLLILNLLTSLRLKIRHK